VSNSLIFVYSSGVISPLASLSFRIVRVLSFAIGFDGGVGVILFEIL